MSGAMINLAQLPAADVIETLDFEAILAEMKADLIARAPELAAALELESDPLTKLLEVCAWRELVIRARVNDGSRAVMLATAAGADLENLAALFGVKRLVIAPGDPNARPPVAPTLESDGDLRFRAQLSLEGLSTAGPRGAYEFHSRSASAQIEDIAVDSPQPGHVRVTVLAREGYAGQQQALLDKVHAALSDERVRPLCDTVNVEAAGITHYSVEAELTVAAGPDSAVVIERARSAAAEFVASARRIGQVVALSGLYAALHREGVTRVSLVSPAAEIDPGPRGVAHCDAITITEAV